MPNEAEVEARRVLATIRTALRAYYQKRGNNAAGFDMCIGGKDIDTLDLQSHYYAPEDFVLDKIVPGNPGKFVMHIKANAATGGPKVELNMSNVHSNKATIKVK